MPKPEAINREVGHRLAALLTLLYAADASLFAPPDKAQALADLFGTTTTLAGHVCHPT